MIARTIATLPWQKIAVVYAEDRHSVGHAPFTIGRDENADLNLAASAVSRQHARLLFDGEGWEVEDLGSRNGTLLNGLRVRGRAPIIPGDVLMLADVVLSIVQAGSAEFRFPPAASNEVLSAAASEDTGPVDRFSLFTTHVDHALLCGETLEAERLFAVHLGRPAEHAAANKLDAATARTVSLLALRLGEATSSSVWLDFVLRLYASSGNVMPLPVVCAMHSLAHRLGGVDRSALRQYATQLSRSRPLVHEERNAVERLYALAAARFSPATDDKDEWPESRRILARPFRGG